MVTPEDWAGMSEYAKAAWRRISPGETARLDAGKVAFNERGPRAPSPSPAASPASPADPIAEARAEGAAAAAAQTREIAALCQLAERPDLFNGLIGATVAEAKAAINAALWEAAFDRVHARVATSPASTEAAQSWDAAFARADARLAASPSPSAGTTAPTAGSADAGWHAAFDAVARR